MAQHMSFSILTDKIAKIRPQTHVGHGGLVVTPFLHGEAFEEDEPFAVQEVFPQLCQQFTQIRQGEVLL